MAWIHYLLIVWIVCIAIALCVRFLPKDSRETTFAQVLILIVGAPFIILMITVLKIGTFIEDKFDEKKRKEKEQEELEDLSLTIAKKREQEERKRENIKKMFSEDDNRY